MNETLLKWKGPDALRPLLVPVGELRTHPDNPRRGNVELIARSLDRHGQLKPVIVAQMFEEEGPTGELGNSPTIFAGNHTYRAATEVLGWTHVAATRPTYLSPDEAERYLHMDNRTSDQATYDYTEYDKILDELAADGRLEYAGFTRDEHEALKREAAELASSALAEFQAGREEDDEPLPAGPGGEAPAASPLVRQVLLTFRPPETFEPFARRLQVLRRHYGTEDTSGTVARAVERQFRRVWGDAPPPSTGEVEP